MGILDETLSQFPSTIALIVSLLSVALGSAVQGSIGLGLGLIAVPVLGLFVPNAMPQAIVLGSLPLMGSMLWHERSSLDPGALPWLMFGRVSGLVPALLVLSVASTGSLQLLIGSATLLAVGLMASDSVVVPVNRFTQFFVGGISGFTGTATGIGGPPIALLYSREARDSLRTTLAFVFLLGGILGIVGYWVSGRLRVVDLVLAGVFVPPVLGGWWIGVLVRDLIKGSWFRRLVLVVVGVAAITLIISSLTG